MRRRMTASRNARQPVATAVAATGRLSLRRPMVAVRARLRRGEAAALQAQDAARDAHLGLPSPAFSRGRGIGLARPTARERPWPWSHGSATSASSGRQWYVSLSHSRAHVRDRASAVAEAASGRAWHERNCVSCLSPPPSPLRLHQVSVRQHDAMCQECLEYSVWSKVSPRLPVTHVGLPLLLLLRGRAAASGCCFPCPCMAVQLELRQLTRPLGGMRAGAGCP